MRYRRLGNTGMCVSAICLGTMTFGGQGSFYEKVGKLGQKEVTAIVARALEAGVNFIDTADAYSYGLSETLTGQALKEIGTRRSDVILATKGFSRVGPGPNETGSSRGHLMDTVEESLKRLQTDHIDLYQIHAQDIVTPVEETMRALEDMVRQGKVRYVGCSNWQAWKIMQAQGIADKRGWARLETVQAYYSLVGRGIEREVVPAITDQKMGLMVWSALAGGFLSGKFAPGKNPEGARRSSFDFPPVDRDKAWPIIDALREIGEAHGTSPARVALGWVLAKPFVTSLIIGAKTLEQLEDNLAASDLKLALDEVNRLDELSVLPEEYPALMVARQNTGRIPEN